MKIALKAEADVLVRSSRVEHALHELLNSLLEDYSQAAGVLDELRNACNPKSRIAQVKNLVY